MSILTSSQKGTLNLDIKPPSADIILYVSGRKYDPSQERCENVFDFEEILGEGTYGNVVKAVHIENKFPAAIKIIDKAKIEENEIKIREKQKWRIQNEIEIHKSLHHENIVEFFTYYESDVDICIVMELCSGGELFDRIVKKGRFSEIEAAHVTRQIASSLAYLHEEGIVHRDVKPENILLKENSENMIIKLTDFGLAKKIPQDDDGKYPTLRASTSGSTAYLAPERLNQHDESMAVDMWSVGCILYFMLMGIPPFYSHNKNEEESDDEIFDAILEGKINFPRPLSPLAKDLIFQLLEKDPQKRITAEQVLLHPWIYQKDQTSESITTITSSPSPLHLSAKQQKQYKSTLNNMIERHYEKIDFNEDEN